jgi:two-component system, OmpR family, sensor histidine kinase TctE
MKNRQPGLKRRMIVQPLIVQLLALLLAFFVLIAILLRLDNGGSVTEEAFAGVAAESIVRRADGELEVNMTDGLRKLVDETPGLWFIAADGQGRTASYGTIPPQYSSLIPVLNQMSYAQLRARNAPLLTAAIRLESSAAGELAILGHGKVTPLTLTVVMATPTVVIPVFLVLALFTLISTPWIVKRTLAGVAKASAQAGQIDVDRRGIRLTEDEIPREIAPLVQAVNAALERLDKGYEQQQRFITDAAHELRTPIAILRVKIEASDAQTRSAFESDVARLANLAEQLLDLHRLENEAPDSCINLGSALREVVADLAPLVIASGKTIEAEIGDVQPVAGNGDAIHRVIANLVLNAAQHGGQHIVVRVFGITCDVEDDGPGIPMEDREQVMEPFHRLKPGHTGIGLGLNLVQEVMRRHGGSVAILGGRNGSGTVVRLTFRSYA